MTHPLRFALLVALLATAAACDSADPEAPDTNALVLVGNQGNFSDENGSVTLYAPDEGTPVQDAIGLGDALVQQITVDGNRAYVLLNFADSFSAGTGRVDVVDLDGRTVTASADVNSPRAMAVVGTTAYVTSLYGNAVTPIDLTTNTAGTPIDVGANPEGIAAVGSRVYVANAGFGAGTTLSVVDATTNEVAETLDAGCEGPRTLAVDAEQEVWVVCTGRTIFDQDFNPVGEVPGAVVILDGATGDEVARFDFDQQLGAASFGQDATYSATEQEAYVIAGQTLLRFDTAANTSTGTLTPGLADDAQVGAVYYSDAADRLYLGTFTAFDVAGEVLLLDRAGEVADRFPAGIAPAAIAAR